MTASERPPFVGHELWVQEMARLNAEEKGFHLRDGPVPVSPNPNPRPTRDFWCVCGRLTDGGLCDRCLAEDLGELF